MSTPRRAAGPGPMQRLRAWTARHREALTGSLARLASSPGQHLMTTAVIGIALALPAGLMVALDNLQAVSGGWERSARISLYLTEDVDGDGARELAGTLGQRSDVKGTRTIAPDEALREFRDHSGFGDSLEALDANPLPAVVVVDPAISAPRAVEGLAGELDGLPEVDLVQVDMAWLRRLHALMETGRRAAMIVATLLALAVVLVVGNTIRLEIQNRREEIEVTKLIGGTDAFIRRPFLYTGLWHGVAGGILAWVLIGIALGLLSGPVRELADLYDSTFRLRGLGLDGGVTLLAAGAALGLIGSWVAVGRHLADIEPH